DTQRRSKTLNPLARNGAPLQRAPICLVNVFVPENEDDLVDVLLAREKFACRFQRDLGGLVDRIAVSAATDCWKSYHVDPILRGQSQRIPMAICQRLGLATCPAAPDRPDSVNDEARRQTVPASNL